MKKKIYNKKTKGYKIDIFFDDDMYICSTDLHKTLKAAKARFIELFEKEYLGVSLEKRITCRFDKQ